MLNIRQKKAIRELLKLKIESREDLLAIKRKIAKKHNLKMIKNSEILSLLPKNIETRYGASLQKILRKRAVRTLSGIAPIAVLTKPWPCPGRCVYCPTEKGVPQSYLSNEPAVMRAIRESYDPYQQVQSRLKALITNGHEPTKIELIVIGGTWSVLPEKYKYWFIKECFRGANDYKVKSEKLKVKSFNKKLKVKKLKERLLSEQRRNEKAKYKIIGITLETRPDYINNKELLEMRELGCTRVELGVQAIDDKILKLNKRGHGVDEIAVATKLLKDPGFKVTYHIMPGLSGSSAAKDLKMFKRLFSDERFQPDQIKFYPTVVTRGSELYHWWKKGKYKPYPQKVLEKLIADCKAAVPPYVRIIRLIRDIPGESIVAGNLVTNLRQVMQRRGVKCACIRCREVRDGDLTRLPARQGFKNYDLRIIKYKASKGEEYFIEAVSKDRRILYGFCRLRFSGDVETRNFASLRETALIRELHVYGELVPVPSTGLGRAARLNKVQHAGLGRRLMVEAEKIAGQNGFKKMAVIAGVGVRGYYRKLGYKLSRTYMIKNI